MALTSISRRSACATIAAILTLTLAACGGTTTATVSPPAPTDSGGAPPTPSASASQEPEGLPRIVLPVDPGSTVEGLVEVDGHDIYARCAGTGSPTIVYFTGWAGDPGDPPKLATAIAAGIESALGPSFRVCSYDRRNIGRSEPSTARRVRRT